MIQIYGRNKADSFSTVTSGWASGLTTLGYDVRVSCWGSNMAQAADEACEACVVTDPTLLGVSACFKHDRIYLVVAPHTDFIPEQYAAEIELRKPHLLPPSEFCAGILRRRFPDLPVTVVPHGVHEDFTPMAPGDRHLLLDGELGQLRTEGCCNLLHFWEGNIDRKGTVELLKALAMVNEVLAGATRRSSKPGRDDGARVALTIITSSFNRLFLLRLGYNLEKVQILPRINAAPHHLRWFYNAFDAVVQPSRAEGFGCIPLEAVCCGVPVVVTECGGHLQWLPSVQSAMRVTMGPEAEMADEGGYSAPTVDVEDLAMAIKVMASSYESYRNAAAPQSPKLRSLHSWTKALQPFLTMEPK